MHRMISRRAFVIGYLAFATVAGIAFIAFFGSRSPVVTIANRSGFTLSNVVVSGTGFSQTIGNIAAGATHKLTVSPTGESDLRVVFDAGGQHIDTTGLAYFEASGGYRVSVTIQPDLKVSAVFYNRLF